MKLSDTNPYYSVTIPPPTVLKSQTLYHNQRYAGGGLVKARASPFLNIYIDSKHFVKISRKKKSIK